MATEVILMEAIEGLGIEGDVVHVAEGYARNFLLPRNLAAPVTEATRRRLEKKRKERLVQMASEKERAIAQAALLEQTSCTITVKAGEEGKLYGSVSAADIVAALKAQGVDVNRGQVMLPEPIRELGVFKVPVKLHPEIESTLKVWIVEE